MISQDFGFSIKHRWIQSYLDAHNKICVIVVVWWIEEGQKQAENLTQNEEWSKTWWLQRKTSWNCNLTKNDYSTY